MARGRFRDVQRAAKEAKEQAGDHTPNFILKDGETATVWFTGKAEDEPHIAARHYTPAAGYRWCGGELCVECHEARTGNKTFRRGSSSAVMNLVDTRLFHKVAKAGSDKNDYVQCAKEDRGRCKLCERKVEVVRSGRRVWNLALSHANALGALNDKIGGLCGSCFKGKVKVVAYECPKCHDELDWDPDEAYESERVKCGKCRRDVVPVEITECTKCDEPVRSSMFECGCPVEITRVGDDKKTTYQFSIAEWPPPEPEDYVLADDMKPFNLDEVTKPLSAQAHAERIGVRNPFNEKDAAAFSRYDQDEGAGEEEDPFDDDEPRSSVRRRAKPKEEEARPARRGLTRRVPAAGGLGLASRKGAARRSRVAIEDDDDVPF